MSEIRFASGELHFPPDRDDRVFGNLSEQRRFAWIRVIKALERHAPEVVQDLGQQVYRPHQTFLRELWPPSRGNKFRELPFRTALFVTQFGGRIEDGALASIRPQLEALCQSLGDWSARHHLPHPIFQALAWQTLCWWSACPSKRGWWFPFEEEPRPGRIVLPAWEVAPSSARSGRRTPVPTRPPQGAKVFTLPGWNPQTETWAAFERRALHELRTYRERVERQHKKWGFKTPPIKTERVHFDWFVLYQVCGRTLSGIGREVDDSLSAPKVYKAVKGIGRLLAGGDWKQWKRPPSKGGRPARD
jgi:hypothetical protein